MATTRRLQQPSPSSASSQTQRYQSSGSLLPPSRGTLKRPRSPSPQSQSEGDTDDNCDAEVAWTGRRRAGCHCPAPHLASSPPSHTTIKHEERRSYRDNGKGKRQALLHENSVEELLTPSTSNKPTRSARLSACKFAKAGCPFTGSQEQVKLHEEVYCSPLYQQLAHYKMLAARSTKSLPPHASTSKLPQSHDTHDDDASSRSNAGHKHSPPTSTKTDLFQTGNVDEDALHAQIHRLQRDLHRAQFQLEEEKKLRTERLRKASERCLELMSLSELGEGKVEVLRMKLKAERELREKLEEEIESMRAADTARESS